MTFTAFASISVTFYVDVTITWGLHEEKNILNCVFCVTEGFRNRKFGMVIMHKIKMILKKHFLKK